MIIYNQIKACLLNLKKGGIPMQQKCGMLINNVNNVKRWFYEKNYEYFIVDSYVNFIGNPNICGSAADIIKLAMVRIYERFEEEGLKSKMILQVHDELNFNVYKEEAEEVKKIVLEEMENVMKLQVPLIADCGEGENWLEAH